MDEPIRISELEQELTSLLNRHSAENGSNTPDFLLAEFLMGCLEQWNRSVRQRDVWYGRDASSFPALERIESDATAIRR